MRRALALAVALACVSAHAGGPAPHHRGWLTGVGVGLVGGGAAVATLGLGFLFSANDANALLKGYYPTAGSAPRPEEAASVRLIADRASGSQTAATVSFILGGALLAGGVACLVLDGRGPAVSVVPLPGGGAVSLALRW